MTDHHALAPYVALRPLSDYPEGHCAAWMDSADRVCGTPCDGWLCPRHEKTATRRRDKDIAKQKTHRENTRKVLLAELPDLIVKRDKLIRQRDAAADIRRHDTDDLAAYGGIGIRQTPRQQRQYAASVDRRLAEYTRLDRAIKDLDHRIAVAETFKEPTS